MQIPPSAGKPSTTAPLGLIFPKGPFRIFILTIEPDGMRRVQYQRKIFKVPDHPLFQENKKTFVRYLPEEKLLVPVALEQATGKKSRQDPPDDKDWPFPDEPLVESEHVWQKLLHQVLQSQGSEADDRHDAQDGESGTEEEEAREVELLLEASLHNSVPVKGDYRWVKLPLAGFSQKKASGWVYFLWNVKRHRIESALVSAGLNETLKRWRFLRAENGRWYGYILKGGESGGERVNIVL